MRYHRGRYSTLRIELRDPVDKRPDTEPRPAVEDVVAASEAFRNVDDGDDDQHSEPSV